MLSPRVNPALFPLVAVFSCLILFVVACGSGTDEPLQNENIHVEDVDPADIPDVGPPDDADAGDTDVPDAGPPPEESIFCDEPMPEPPSGERCVVEQGSSDRLLLRGTILAGDEVYEEGSVLIDGQSPNRRIDCVGCDCIDEADAQDATVVSCPDGVISPGLINPHDHLTFAEGRPQLHGEDRFDHRHDWRRGLRGHDQISTWPRTGGHREVILYGELRMLLGGSTSIAGSTGFTDASGLLRNLDQPFDTEGLDGINVNYTTFPLGDGGFPQLLASGCGYPNIDSESNVEDGIYLPHISEGVDAEAQNELTCLAGESGSNLIRENTSIIHGIAVDARDVALIADRGSTLVWSPRTNIDLYGNTAPVSLYKRFDVPIALGTDWSTSGSMNMLRELECADYLNRMHFNETFTEADLWKMATYNAALSMGAEHKLGLIDPGYVADITIFDSRGRSPYRAVIDADIDEISLVMRGGEPLYGDAQLIEDLVSDDDLDGCEMLDVCDRQRRACIELDTGQSLAEIEDEIHSQSYPLFFCGEPEDEPTCVPSRPSEYDGISTPSDSSGDGIADSMDNCPDYFNPIRPMDGNLQSDINGTGMGDVCDPCPLSEDPDCESIDPDDWSGDGVPNDEDICPFHYNPDQEDSSGDGFGDACSPCPDHEITPGSPCPTTIYDIKTGETGDGQEVQLGDALVTAVQPDEGLFVQVHPDDDLYDGVEHSGLYVYLANSSALDETSFPEAGDRIHIVGTVSDFFGQLQIANVTDIEIESSGNSLPDPHPVEPDEIATGGSLQTELEGTLVTIDEVTVTDVDVPPGPGDSAPTHEFIVDDSLHINDFFYRVSPFPEVDDIFEGITGVLRWANDNNKLEPRFEEDFDFPPPEVDRIEPETSFVEVGSQAVPTFDVYLTRIPEEPSTVDLAYSESGVVDGPDSVVVEAGELSATVDIQGLSAQEEPIIVEATREDLTVSGEIRVYDDQTERTLDSLSAPSHAYFVNETVTLTAALNVPAGAGGESMTFELTPDSDASFPTDITLAEGERTAEIDVELGDDVGTFVAFVHYGDASESFGFQTFDELTTQVETFTNFETSGSQYADGSFVGDAGFSWDYTEARQAPAGDTAPSIDGTSMILRDTSASLSATDIPGGISAFSVEMKQAFTGSGSRQIELFINGESMGTSVAFEGQNEIHEFAVDDIDVSGEFDLEIWATTGRQVTIDNLTWTSGLPVDPDELDFESAELDGFNPESAVLEISDEASPVLELNLLFPAIEETTVDLSYDDDAAIEGPGEVVFSPSESTVEIPLRALQTRDDPVGIHATLDGDTVSAEVHPVGPPELVGFAPESTLLEVSGSAEPALALQLERATQNPMEVDLEYTPDGVLDGPETIDIDPGEDSVMLELQAISAEDDPVTITAVHDDSQVTGQVRTYDDDTPRAMQSLQADHVALLTHETMTLTATLDIPAGDEGETIDFDIRPDSDATFPSQVTVASNEQHADVEVEIGANEGRFVAVASLEDSAVTYPFEVFAQPDTSTETFDDFQTSGSGYSDGSFVGSTGVTWNYTESRDAPVGSDAPAIDEPSMILRDTTSSLSATDVPGGIESFSVQMTQAFTGLGDRQIELFVDGVSHGTSTPFGSEDEDFGEIYEFAVDDVSEFGSFDIEVVPVTDRQITIDNLTWTAGLPVDPDTIEFDVATLDQFSTDEAFVEVTGESSPALELQLEAPALEAIVVDLTYDDDGDIIDGPQQLAIDPGEMIAEISLEALQTSSEPVEITASYDGDEVTANLNTFDESTPRQIVAYQACHGVLLDQPLEFFVELDVPAGQSGLSLPLNIDPADHLASAPDDVVFSDGDKSATFTLTFDQQEGPVEVEIATDDDDDALTVDVSDLSPPFVEDFSELDSTPGGYSEPGDFFGNYGFLWFYDRAQRTESWAIDDASVILNKTDEDEAFVRTHDLPGGISSFSVDMMKAHTSDDERQLELFVNDESIATSEVFGDESGEDTEVHIFSVDDLDVACLESLEINAIGDGQVSIDNITWTPVEP